MVTEGRVFVDGQKAVSPGRIVGDHAKIEVRSAQRFVGRGAYKLEEALDAFKIDAAGKVCADIGASTGGFTEALLERGAKKVYAIDTARGKLALKLRTDQRVAVMERTDVRDLASLPEPMDIAVIDVSLIPLREILPSVRRLLRPQAQVVALFKPQYETHDPRMLRRGIIREDSDRDALLKNFMGWLETNGWRILNQIKSPILGSKGNVEYLLYLRHL